MLRKLFGGQPVPGPIVITGPEPTLQLEANLRAGKVTLVVVASQTYRYRPDGSPVAATIRHEVASTPELEHALWTLLESSKQEALKKVALAASECLVVSARLGEV